jgi:hypothetical protein
VVYRRHYLSLWRSVYAIETVLFVVVGCVQYSLDASLMYLQYSTLWRDSMLRNTLKRGRVLDHESQFRDTVLMSVHLEVRNLGGDRDFRMKG